MNTKAPKQRLDTILVDRGLVPTRHKAQGLIMAGKVSVNGVLMDKPGRPTPSDCEISISETMPFVSRGGVKLDSALEHFKINPSGLTVLDAGASTGGFTHCLLLRGAARVIAVDVGYGRLDYTLRSDSRVIPIEKTNIRYFDLEKLPYKVDAAVADVSFISLELVLPKLYEAVPGGGWVVTLVKPQFEVGRPDVNKGVVRDPGKIRHAIEKIKRIAHEVGFHVAGEVESPIKGPKGNREFFLWLKKY
jgi:23S rRNA (cytidine1920-2'-O)/16S rRNA (cytidine1409-2'-O)-methyltransferase